MLAQTTTTTTRKAPLRFFKQRQNILTNTTTDVATAMQFKPNLLRIQAGSACNGEVQDAFIHGCDGCNIFHIIQKGFDND
jgi:hypothetical protein